jgi:serralysin
MATTIGGITLNGDFSDWLAAESLMNSANSVPGYQVYGALINDPTLGENYVIGVNATNPADAAIASGTVIYLNTDQNDSTGFSPFGTVGAEYQVKFLDDLSGALQAYLYSGDGTTALNGGAPLASAFSSNGECVELAIPQVLLSPTGGTAPTAVNFDVLLNNSAGLPVSFDATTPQYVIPDPAGSPPPTTIASTIILDGTFTDWPTADSVMTPGNTVAGYQVYGAKLNDAALSETYVIGIDATNSADAVIGANTIIYLNTDQNNATGYSPFGAIGAEYEVQFSYGPNSELEPFLYSVTSAGVATKLNNGQPLNYGFSSNGTGIHDHRPRNDCSGRPFR